MASPFDSLTLAQLEDYLRKTTPPWVAVNVAYATGDHWQNGAGWVGPRPDASDPAAAQVMNEIARAFTAQNAIGEVVDRHEGGIIGSEPNWGFTVRRALKPGKAPTRAEQALIDEAEAALTTWWDVRGGLTHLQQLARQLLLAEHAALRIFVPAGLRVLDSVSGLPVVPAATSLETALRYIYIDRPAVGLATVLIDPGTQQECGVLLYKEQKLLSTEEGATVVELTYLDLDTGETVLRQMRKNGGDTAPFLVNLAGQILLHQLERPLFVTESIRQLQAQLNMTRTMSGRNVVQGGFLERIILNAQLPGSYVDDPTAPMIDGERKRFVPDSLKLGPGRTAFISGEPILDEKNRITGYTSPVVNYRDPVSTATFEENAQALYRAILGEARQLHALMSGDATASGTSRVQARADFAKSLLITKTALDKAGRWLLETALALAATFAGTPGRYDVLRATFECRVDTGPISADERRALGDEVEAGRLSLETFLAIVGHEDVAAELARIAAEKAERMANAPQVQAPTTPAPTDPNQPAEEADGEDPEAEPDPAEPETPEEQGSTSTDPRRS